MTLTDVRWRQRLQSYTRAVSLLTEAVSQGLEKLNTLEKEGTIQRFEFTLELGWNLLKDYLESSGVELVSVSSWHCETSWPRLMRAAHDSP